MKRGSVSAVTPRFAGLLSDYPNSGPPMTGMITGRREEHNCQALRCKSSILTISAATNQILGRNQERVREEEEGRE